MLVTDDIIATSFILWADGLCILISVVGVFQIAERQGKSQTRPITRLRFYKLPFIRDRVPVEKQLHLPTETLTFNTHSHIQSLNTHSHIKF